MKKTHVSDSKPSVYIQWRETERPKHNNRRVVRVNKNNDFYSENINRIKKEKPTNPTLRYQWRPKVNNQDVHKNKRFSISFQPNGFKCTFLNIETCKPQNSFVSPHFSSGVVGTDG